MFMGPAMLDVTFTSRPSAAEAALVVGVWEGGNQTATARGLDGDRLISRALTASPRFSGKEGQCVTVQAPAGMTANRLLLLGLGPFGDMDAHRARRLGAVVAAELLTSGEDTVAVALELEPDTAAAFGQGLALRAHRPTPWRTRTADEDRVTLAHAAIRVAATGAAEELWVRAKAEVEGVLLARDLGEAPGNILTPSAFVERARALEALGVTVEVVQGVEALRDAGCGLLAAVGQGAAQPPALLILRWRGTGGGQRPVGLVGKGITFDAGGLSLKPGAGMEHMKGDMGGAAAVLGAVHALASMQAACPVTAVLAIAENVPGAAATRPGDVVTARNGLTVEVIDTDAEGRLALADALATLAAEPADRRPGVVVDIATLTGTVVTALGRHYAGLYTPDDGLARALESAGGSVGEPVWRLPLTHARDEDLDSPIADIRQCAPVMRWLPDALHAARFLRRFPAPGQRWAHVDMAGVGRSDDDRPLGPAGATGWGVRLLTALVLDRHADAPQ
ncbi:Cytosol aminopeptidase PepA [Caenispirillum salinarum AK4]|uniref:Probable cytosol aminopeptidase n=1 Tax=Caenispirillum salinarum AK4 TaxID=1238182 RepID=K9GWW5_9PROT|nr:leucyl aminopeptidase [Caenispirillum salinarum]EKV30480.1 Cytosol aminopeptidase PepA [Caenispirillum salinarum AK4]